MYTEQQECISERSPQVDVIKVRVNYKEYWVTLQHGITETRKPWRCYDVMMSNKHKGVENS